MEGKGSLSRRAILKAGAFGLAASSLGMLDALAWMPKRLAHAGPTALPDIQFDIDSYIGPAQAIDGVVVRFGPVFTYFVTARLLRTPTARDQEVLAGALDTIEDNYPFSPSGVFTFVAYGIPYFERLPAHLVSEHLPRLLSNPARAALEEAMPSPTDVAPSNPGITKERFNVPVRIEKNDLLLTLRSDSRRHMHDVVGWIMGSDVLQRQHVPSPAYHGLFRITSIRVMFQQAGLPRRLADRYRLPFASRVNPHSPMWMGFADQQVAGSGPSSITTFQGNASARFTHTHAGDYFFNGAIQHLSHVIQDLEQFYDVKDEPFTERVQYLFRSNPIPSRGNSDQFSDGGGPAFLDNVFQGPDDAHDNAAGRGTFEGKHRMGHLAALQRFSRASDGTPIHLRMDGPGYDAMDVPGGIPLPKLQFTIFVPSAEFFAAMRRNQASLDLVQKFGVAADDNGIERFLTATRRQNFLIPPRRHRAFPLLELT